MEIARYIIDDRAAGGKTFRDQQEYGTYGGNKIECLKKILKRQFIWNIE